MREAPDRLGSQALAETASTEFVVDHGVGIHARPSLMFTKLAQSFPCTIEMEVDGSGRRVSAKSIVKVLAARVRKGSTLRIVAHGNRAAEAVAALRELVENDFGEERQQVDRP